MRRLTWLRPSTGSMGNLTMASGFFSATSSMLTPPSLLAMQQGPFIDRSFMKAM